MKTMALLCRFADDAREWMTNYILFACALLFAIVCAGSLCAESAFADDGLKGMTPQGSSVRVVSPDGTVSERAVGDGTLESASQGGVSLLGIDVASEKVTVVNFNCKKSDGIVDFVDFYSGAEGYISRKAGADAAYLGTVKDKSGKRRSSS